MHRRFCSNSHTWKAFEKKPVLTNYEQVYTCTSPPKLGRFYVDVKLWKTCLISGKNRNLKIYRNGLLLVRSLNTKSVWSLLNSYLKHSASNLRSEVVFTKRRMFISFQCKTASDVPYSDNVFIDRLVVCSDLFPLHLFMSHLEAVNHVWKMFDNSSINRQLQQRLRVRKKHCCGKVFWASTRWWGQHNSLNHITVQVSGTRQGDAENNWLLIRIHFSKANLALDLSHLSLVRPIAGAGDEVLLPWPLKIYLVFLSFSIVNILSKMRSRLPWGMPMTVWAVQRIHSPHSGFGKVAKCRQMLLLVLREVLWRSLHMQHPLLQETAPCIASLRTEGLTRNAKTVNSSCPFGAWRGNLAVAALVTLFGLEWEMEFSWKWLSTANGAPPQCNFPVREVRPCPGIYFTILTQFAGGRGHNSPGISFHSYCTTQSAEQSFSPTRRALTSQTHAASSRIQ